MNVVRHIVRQVDVRRVIDEPITWTANNNASVNDTRRTARRCSTTMEVNWISPADVVSSTRCCCKHDAGAGGVADRVFCEVKVKIIQRNLLVGTAKFGELRIGNIHVVRMHEHDVAAMGGRGIF